LHYLFPIAEHDLAPHEYLECAFSGDIKDLDRNLIEQVPQHEFLHDLLEGVQRFVEQGLQDLKGLEVLRIVPQQIDHVLYFILTEVLGLVELAHVELFLAFHHLQLDQGVLPVHQLQVLLLPLVSAGSTLLMHQLLLLHLFFPLLHIQLLRQFLRDIDLFLDLLLGFLLHLLVRTVEVPDLSLGFLLERVDGHINLFEGASVLQSRWVVMLGDGADWELEVCDERVGCAKVLDLEVLLPSVLGLPLDGLGAFLEVLL